MNARRKLTKSQVGVDLNTANRRRRRPHLFNKPGSGTRRRGGSQGFLPWGSGLPPPPPKRMDCLPAAGALCPFLFGPLTGTIKESNAGWTVAAALGNLGITTIMVEGLWRYRIPNPINFGIRIFCKILTKSSSAETNISIIAYNQ